MRRGRRALLCALGAATALAAAGPAAATVLPVWSIQAAPFALTISSGPSVLAQEAAGAALAPGPARRLSYETSDGAYHTLTDLLAQEAVPDGERYTVATDEPGRTAQVVVTTAARSVHVSWTLEPSAGVTAVNEAFYAHPDERFLGGGEHTGYVDLTGQVVPLKVWTACRESAPVPFYISSYGYAVSVASTSIGRAEFRGTHDGTECDLGPEPQCPLAGAPTENQLCLKSSSLAYDVYAGTPAQTLAAYTADTGRAQVPPVSTFGLIKWRDRVTGASQVLDDVTTLQRLSIPIEWVLLDNPWELASCIGSLSFDPRGFPGGGRKLIQDVHARGVKFMLWVSPLVQLARGCPSPAYPASGLLGSGPTRELDLTDPRVRRVFEAKLKALARLGVDGVKADRGGGIDLEPLALAGGPGVVLHNVYPYLFARSVVDAFRSVLGSPFTAMFHTAAPQSRRIVPAIWAGDQVGSFDGLQDAIRAAASAGVSGFPIWGSDIGGYDSAGPSLTPDLFVRWAQLGAVSPLFEVGGIGENARFWRFGAPTVNLFRQAAVLHYELFPTLYELARQAARTGAPVLRPLAFAYPSDPASWDADLELLLGPSLLALPVTVPSGRPSIQYFPAGRWVPVWGGADVVGPTSFAANVPESTLPLYLAAGSAVPFDFRTPELWSVPWGLNDLGRPGRLGWLYAPGDGPTSASAAGENLTATPSADGIVLSLSGPRRELQLLVLTPTTPRSVTVAGRTLPRSGAAAALRRVANGWTLERGRFQGVIVKVTAGSERWAVTLSF